VLAAVNRCSSVSRDHTATISRTCPMEGRVSLAGDRIGRRQTMDPSIQTERV
jgi:hypothetical protein